MKLLHKPSGEWLYFGLSEEERAELRLTRLRVAIWAAINTIAKVKDDRTDVLHMYTLTYAKVDEWGSKHISCFVRWLNAQGCKGYVWVAELQKRGAVHYHVCAMMAQDDPWVKPGAANGGWPYGFTWVTPSIRYPWYIMKYISKGSEHGQTRRFPKGLRMYGVSRRICTAMVNPERSAFYGLRLPAWFRDGAKGIIDLGNCRVVSGGVGVGQWKAISPFSLTDFPRVASFGEVM